MIIKNWRCTPTFNLYSDLSSENVSAGQNAPDFFTRLLLIADINNSWFRQNPQRCDRQGVTHDVTAS
jgi:hypothetical protein